MRDSVSKVHKYSLSTPLSHRAVLLRAIPFAPRPFLTPAPPTPQQSVKPLPFYLRCSSAFFHQRLYVYVLPSGRCRGVVSGPFRFPPTPPPSSIATSVSFFYCCSPPHPHPPRQSRRESTSHLGHALPIGVLLHRPSPPTSHAVYLYKRGENTRRQQRQQQQLQQQLPHKAVISARTMLILLTIFSSSLSRSLHPFVAGKGKAAPSSLLPHSLSFALPVSQNCSRLVPFSLLRCIRLCFVTHPFLSKTILLCSSFLPPTHHPLPLTPPPPRSSRFRPSSGVNVGGGADCPSCVRCARRASEGVPRRRRGLHPCGGAGAV